MKRLLGFVFLFLIGCEDTREPDCVECGLEIYSSLEKSNGNYILEYNEDLAQTYTMLDATTECGWSQHLQWDTDYQYKIVTDWVSLVNPASMTDEDGNAHIVFAVWEEFIGYTVSIYGGYVDDHGHTKMDSVKVYVVDNE